MLEKLKKLHDKIKNKKTPWEKMIRDTGILFKLEKDYYEEIGIKLVFNRTFTWVFKNSVG